MDLTKYKPTYGYDAKGNRQDVYLKDGKGYTADGNRVGDGWTVQAGGKSWKMNNKQGQGLRSQGHNIPTFNSMFDTDTGGGGMGSMQNFLDQNRYKRQDWQQQGADRYKPIYDSQRQALEAHQDRGVSAYRDSMRGIDTQYDEAVDMQNERIEATKGKANLDAISRGMGRSASAVARQQGVDIEGDRQISQINRERSDRIASIEGKIANLRNDVSGQLSNLDSNRTIMEQQMADQLEDRDFGFWYDQAQLNQPFMQQMFQNQMKQNDMADALRLEQYEYDRDNLRGLNMGDMSTDEGRLRKQGQKFRRDDALWDNMTDQEKYALMYEDGTLSNKNMLNRRDFNLETMKKELEIQKKYGGGGGYGGFSGGGGYGGYGGYSPYGGYGSRQGNIDAGYEYESDNILGSMWTGNARQAVHNAGELRKMKSQLEGNKQFRNEVSPKVQNKILSNIQRDIKGSPKSDGTYRQSPVYRKTFDKRIRDKAKSGNLLDFANKGFK